MMIYLAARYELHPHMRQCRDELVALGHCVTSRWIEGGHSAIGAPSDASKFAQDDWGDLKTADCIIFFAENPTVGIPRGGRHVEFGMALAWGKRLIVVGFRENVFHYLPQVEFYEGWRSVLRKLRFEKAVVGTALGEYP